MIFRGDAMARHWTLQLHEGPGPLYLRIGHAITEAI
jgi:hypothetical protein